MREKLGIQSMTNTPDTDTAIMRHFDHERELLWCHGTT